MFPVNLDMLKLERDIFFDQDVQMLPLFRMVYTSKSTYGFFHNRQLIQQLTERSAEYNPKYGITGVLYFANGRFYQYLEGTEKRLTDLKNQLLLDSRHELMRIWTFDSVAERRFLQWDSKSYFHSADLKRQAQQKKLLPLRPSKWQDNEWESMAELLAGDISQYK